MPHEGKARRALLAGLVAVWALMGCGTAVIHEGGRDEDAGADVRSSPDVEADDAVEDALDDVSRADTPPHQDADVEPGPDTAEDAERVEDVPDTDVAPDPCEAIAPVADGSANRATILRCLRERGVARLSPGTFVVDDTLDMPDGSRLLGDTTWPHVVLTGGAQAVVRTHDDNEVAFLRLDGNHAITVPHGGVAMMSGSRAFIHDNHIQNADGPLGEDRVTGVRFSNTDGRDNRVLRNQIHHVHYGVIFDLFPAGAVNTLEGNTIFQVRCDGVTFRGYGVAVGNEIHHAGWQCLNPPESPIPGGGFYSLENAAGAIIRGNHAHHTCGMPLDLDRVQRFVIEDNTFEEPGSNDDGHTACGAGATAHLIDVGYSVVRGNTFLNHGRHTMESDPNHVMSATGSGVPTDLPSGTAQAVAFMLTRRRDQTQWLTSGNDISDNRFIATCTSPCVGLGYFVGRSTGFGADGVTWSAESTNYFRRNSPFGSNIGSKRCGGNWYAADSACGANPDADCNVDDSQHEGAGHDWARNDDCGHYR